MATYLELSKATEKLLSQTESVFRKLDYQAPADNVKEQLKAFREKELTVVVAGEARRGKSSLLNALLNEKESVFPVDLNVCTNVVTILRYGEEEKIEAYIEDPNNAAGYRVETVARSEIADYVSEKGNPNNFKRVKMLRAAVPNELLKEGIMFVDTPGVGSLNVEHAEATYSFLPNADLLLFVTDTLSGMTETELDFLRRGYSYCQNVIFAVTKRDLAQNYDVFVEDNREKISNALEIPAGQVEIIPVSSLAKLSYLETGRKSFYINSNFRKLEEAIWSTVARTRYEIMLQPYLAGAKAEIDKLLDNVVAQYQTLGNAVASELAEELTASARKLDQLQDQGAEWRSDLNLTFSLLQTSVNTAQQTISQSARDLIEERVREMDKKICEPENYRKLVSDVNDLITRGLLNIRELITDETGKKLASMQEALEMELSSNESILSKLQFRPDDLEIRFQEKKVADQIVTKGRNISMNAMGGTAIGSILGGIVGFCIGGPAGVAMGATIGGSAGTLFGGTKGCIEAFSKYDQLDVNTVSRALNKHVATSMTGVASCVSTVLTEVRIAVSTAFEKQLKKRIKELQENISHLKQNISLEKNELPKRQAELKAQIGALEKLRKYYDGLEKTAGDEAAPVTEKKPEVPGAKEPAAEPAERKAPEKKEVEYAFL